MTGKSEMSSEERERKFLEYQEHGVGKRFEVKRDQEYVYIPPGCRERFLKPPFPSIQFLKKKGIWMSGLSELVKGYVIDRHRINHHLVLFTLDGQAELRIADGEHQQLRPGDVLIAPGGSSYSYWVDDRWEIAWLHLVPGTLWNAAMECDAHARPSKWIDEIVGSMHGYLRESERGFADSSSILHAYVDLIVAQLQRELVTPRAAMNKSGKVLEKVWVQVETDLARSWDVHAVSALAKMSRSYFHRIVVQTTGMSPMQVVKSMRMERASDLLVSTNDTIESIATTIGYESPFSFSKAFKRYAGVSPSQYREGRR